MGCSESAHNSLLEETCLPGRHAPSTHSDTPHGLEDILGRAAWKQLPDIVRRRFAPTTLAVDYVGEFEIVRASRWGRLIAWAGRLLGTPVAPYTGERIPAAVRVSPSGRGIEWRREYYWQGRSPCVVRSIKVIGADGLVEELPAFLRMSLDVYVEASVLHFTSRAYYFEFPIPGLGRRVRLTLPRWLSPGTTHVEHVDEGSGFFRFTMTVAHPYLGETFYQTGRFQAGGD